MSRLHATALRTTRRLLRILLALNLAVGVAIVGLLVASVLAEGAVMDALGARAGPGNTARIVGMRMVMALGLLGVPLVQLVLGRLLTVVDTVHAGDPFIAENAGRLRAIAWAVLGLELLHVAVVFTAALASSETAPLDIGWSFGVTRWLAILLLFVLAQVFEQGADMREDLEGTV